MSNKTPNCLTDRVYTFSIFLFNVVLGLVSILMPAEFLRIVQSTVLVGVGDCLGTDVMEVHVNQVSSFAQSAPGRVETRRGDLLPLFVGE